MKTKPRPLWAIFAGSAIFGALAGGATYGIASNIDSTPALSAKFPAVAGPVLTQIDQEKDKALGWGVFGGIAIILALNDTISRRQVPDRTP